MYKLCKSEQSAARQRALELGLLEAMGEQVYEDISVSDLCQRLQIPRKSFYRYFTNKDGALFALLDHTLMEFVQSPNPSSGAQAGSPVGDLERFFLFWHDRRELLDALLRSRLSGMLVERATAHALHERMMPDYLLNKDQKSQRMAMTFSVCGLLSLVIQWHQDNYDLSAKEMAELASMMLSQPLIPGWR